MNDSLIILRIFHSKKYVEILKILILKRYETSLLQNYCILFHQIELRISLKFSSFQNMNIQISLHALFPKRYFLMNIYLFVKL